MASEMTNYIIVSQGTKAYTTRALYYIDQIWTTNIYISSIRENVNKKVQFGTAMSLAKTSVQIAVSECAVTELIGMLMQFNMKFRHKLV